MTIRSRLGESSLSPHTALFDLQPKAPSAKAHPARSMNLGRGRKGPADALRNSRLAMNKSRLDSQASGRFKSIVLKETSGDDSDLRAGEFERIDPLGGHPHWSIRPNWTVQKAYLAELRKPLLLGIFPVLPGIYHRLDRELFLRAVITKGVASALESITTTLSNIALISMLIGAVCIGEVTIHSPELCQIAFNASVFPPVKEACDAQVYAATFATAAAFLNTSYCVAIICILNFWPADSVAFQVYRCAFLIRRLCARVHPCYEYVYVACAPCAG